MRAADSIHNLTHRNVETIAQIERVVERRRKGAERLASTVAALIGSWWFILTQSAIVVIWAALNCITTFTHWDPYPFVLLNLLLSIQVAFTSPIIIMSQNRQARVSDSRNHLNLQISLLSEQENTEMLKLLRLLCEKAGVELGGTASPHRTLEQSIEPEDVFRQIAESQSSKSA